MRALRSTGNPLISIDVKSDLDFAEPNGGYATPELQLVQFDHMLAFKVAGHQFPAAL